ncbi:mismatch-specific DNA-glycosylase [Paenibacillus hexagrammi]|uniref:Mismatch-specific DNA-glycosylase n=1 Tax=Paenibacillus hexagrammi TaxID=2908839 RepID=A0ABY3STH3_9BACL|nr:mismatch-specific DNA-glycosylase [Paenibacillus sp. YPD9-1]UJF36267.1 mismatch-specific DNA-glycosylase [Paenibacillus sp. YPD9-1]
MGPISDHIRHHLRILFVGYNPSIRSGETGHHYANPTNRFYRILHAAGLTDRLYSAAEDQDLLDIGYGFTNIVARPTLTAAEIKPEEYKKGRETLREKIKTFQPRIVCFVGKGVYEQYSGRKGIVWGAQSNPVVRSSIEYVCPSSSGLVRMKLDEMVSIFSGMRAFMEKEEECT